MVPQIAMTFVSSIASIAVLLHAASAAIVPEYQSIIWKHDGKNFWAPLNLNTKIFALESPAGSAPDALHKREDGYASPEYQACTILTLGGVVTASAIDTKLDQYQSINDDVWSASQVCELCHNSAPS